MALDAAIEWEVRTTGSDNNGGGFKSGAAGSDYSTQDAAQKTDTDLTMHGADDTKCQPVTDGVAAADVGNVVQITAGVNWTPGFYEITAQDGTYWTLDRSPAAAAEANLGTFFMGGGLAEPGKASGAHVADNTIWVKTGTYTISSNSPDVSNGRVVIKGGAQIEGYNAAHRDLGTKPTLQATTSMGAATGVVMSSTNYGRFSNIIIDVNSQANSHGCRTGGVANLYRVQVDDSTNESILLTGTALIVECVVNGGSSKGIYGSGGAGNSHCVRCVMKGCGGTGIDFSSAGTIVGCIADGCNVGFVVAVAVDCVAYNSTGDGFQSATHPLRCIAEANGAYGFDGIDYLARVGRLMDCAGYNNTSGAYRNYNYVSGFQNLTGSPFVNAAADDFSLDNVSGEGADCRQVSFAFPDLSTTSYDDIGAAGHQESAAGGLITNPGTAGGIRG